MKILVCIKEVPDTEAVPEIDHEHKTVTYDRRRWSFRINSSDEYALEEALILKETIPDTTVDVASSGTEEISPLLRRALEIFVLQQQFVQIGVAGHVHDHALDPVRGASRLRR